MTHTLSTDISSMHRELVERALPPVTDPSTPMPQMMLGPSVRTSCRADGLPVFSFGLIRTRIARAEFSKAWMGVGWVLVLHESA